jgi:hypothetical protein
MDDRDKLYLVLPISQIVRGKILKHRLAETLTGSDKSAGIGEEHQETKRDGA